jgi:cell division protein FtsI/penicillin-binding protein 2
MATGCTALGGDDTPDPEPAAELLADALGSGEVADAPWSEDTAEQATTRYPVVVEGMGDLAAAVEVTDVSEAEATDTEPASATATLAWSWPVAEQDWTYTSEASLVLVDDEWVVAWDPSLVEPSLTEREVLDRTRIAPARGDLLGTGGTPLMTARPVVRFGIDRTEVAKSRAGDSAQRLALLLGIDVSDYVRRVEAAGDKAFVEALVLRSNDIPLKVQSDYGTIPGVRTHRAEIPLGPTPDFAAPLLGRVGEVTAEMIKEDPERYQLGDVAGLSGLQLRYDDVLAGTPGVVVDAVTPKGKKRELFRVEAIPGEPLSTTMDLDLQREAERLLADVRPASALVAIRPSTGDLLVAANGPGNAGVNLATYGQAAPGSTFKTVSSLALLRSGLTPESRVPCTPSIVVDGKRFTNYSDYPPSGLGDITLRTAVANSCNTAFISQAERPGRRGLADAAASLGLGIDHDLGFPAYFGQVPPSRSSTEAAAHMIGQGTILASPMVMATVIASVQAGRTVVPRLVDSVDVEVPARAPAMTSEEARQLTSMLRGVVISGSGALLADVPGAPVIAKTGTAEFEKDGEVLTHAWMIAAQGDLAVAVYVDIGESGSATAGPIVEAFLRAAG